MSILVLGIGNITMSDDAVGVRVVRRLRREYLFTPDLAIVEGGLSGLALLPLLEETERLLVVDAVDNGAAPGTLIRLLGDNLPIQFQHKFSSSQSGVPDLLAAAELLGFLPRETVVWGVQPAMMDFGFSFSPAVEASFEILLEKVLHELSRWGVTATEAATSTVFTHGFLTIPVA